MVATDPISQALRVVLATGNLKATISINDFRAHHASEFERGYDIASDRLTPLILSRRA